MTTKGKFYVIKNIKEPFAEMFFDLKTTLGFDADNVIDFFFIDERNSYSKKLELVLCMKDHHGLFNIVEKSEDEKDKKSNKDNEDKAKEESKKKKNKKKDNEIEPEELNTVFFIKSDTRERYDPKFALDQYSNNDIGIITAMAISPSNQIALYKIPTSSSNNAVFIFDSKLDIVDILSFDEKSLLNNKQNDINIEIKNCLLFPANSQFLWCGNDAVCICSRRYICLLNLERQTLKFQVIIRKINFEVEKDAKLMHCITEIDGLRVITQDGLFFINKVPDYMLNTCYDIEETPARKLIASYNNTNDNCIDCDQYLRKLIPELPEALKELYLTATQVNKKNIQTLLLKIVNYGKQFVSKDTFNFHSFAKVCIDLRIINNLHWKNIFMTYEEYSRLSTKKLINLLIRSQNFFLASEIANELEYKSRKIYQRWAYSQIKAINRGISDEDEDAYFDIIISKLKPIPKISYLKLSKKASKYNRIKMSLKFLENEKNIIAKIPMYIEVQEWEKAIEVALETYDSNIIFTIFDKLFKSKDSSGFFKCLQNFKGISPIVKEYLNKFRHDDYIILLEKTDQYEELFFYYLKKYFHATELQLKYDLILKLKESIKYIKKKDNKESSFDIKFYASYIDNIENFNKLKNGIVKEKYIEQNKEEYKNELQAPYDNALLDVFIVFINKDVNLFTESKYKAFEVSPRIANIMKIRFCASSSLTEHLNQLMGSEFKKSNLTHLDIGEALFEANKLNQASNMIKMMQLTNDLNYFDLKIHLLILRK